MGKGEGCCATNPASEAGYAMDWRENSHDMDELVVKIMQQGKIFSPKNGLKLSEFSISDILGYVPPFPPLHYQQQDINYHHDHPREQVQRRHL